MVSRLLTVMLLFLLLCGCTGVRTQVREAEALNQRGAVREALAAYKAIDLRRPGRPDVRAGMQSAAQRVFDRMEDAASAYYLAGDYPGGEQARIDAEAFKDECAHEGLIVEWSGFFAMRRTEARVEWLDDLYAKAEQAFKDDRFNEAADMAGRVLQHDPERAHAQHLQRMARCEPKYRDGKRAFDMGSFGQAYRILREVAVLDPNYKDNARLLQAAKHKASFTVVYLVVPSAKPSRWNEKRVVKPSRDEVLLASAMEEAIVELKDPLVRLIDRKHTEALLAEQLRALNGGVQEGTAAQAGQLLGAQFVLTGEVLVLNDDRIDLRISLIDASTGRIHVAQQVSALRREVQRGQPVRDQLMAIVAQRAAEHLRDFDRFAD